MGLIIWKILGYGVLLVFVGGIAFQLLAVTLGILQVILTPIIIAVSIAISVVTYPVTFLLRCFGFNVRSFHEFGIQVWRKWKASLETNSMSQKKSKEKAWRQKYSHNDGLQIKEEARIDPWKVLDIQPGSPKEMITKAYRRKVSINHPDKVAGLDPALQSYANSRTLLIKEAYDTLMNAV